ncbi:hypothetical protein ACWX0K_19285 [Nitrobacteraceae bacterium UC4446_H13]|jgi:hypothetical protein
MILPHIPPALTRLRVKPDEPTEGPPAIDGYRPPGQRRMHSDLTVAKVRHLVETTGLSYREIGLKVGIPHSNITGWKRDFGWQRPLNAPRPWDMIPTARQGRRQKLRKLAERLRALAERMIHELEETPGVDLDKLMQALQVVKMARLEAIGRRGRFRSPGRGMTGFEWASREQAIRGALKDMRRAGVDIDRAPQEALDLVIDANLPVEEDHPALRPRGARQR